MSSSFFYLQKEKNARNACLIDALQHYAEEKAIQVYVLDSPLTDSKYSYQYRHALVILSPIHQITFVDMGNGEEEFIDYVDDFVEDIGSISDKFRYKEHIGRPRSWRNELISVVSEWNPEQQVDAFLDNRLLADDATQRKVQLLLSLMTGSINDIERVTAAVPDSLLDKVKQKIVLFDGDQSRFVYQSPTAKLVKIQGLSGTGKTELLLHKMKDIYIEDKDSRIVFTCHNKILADSLRNRIPAFFNFMRVEEQILWHERLWCFHAWGAGNNYNTGTYSYICNFYGISFQRYSINTPFEAVCKTALEQLTSQVVAEKGYAFDYVFIDESQDFPEAFFNLCERVTSKAVYVAGDIFQSIFSDPVIGEIEPDFLLSKCYRTDPRTLMFAHAVGMGLFETPKLKWLQDAEWQRCGYNVEKNEVDGLYRLSREPLRRFEDLEQENYSSIQIVETSKDIDEGEEAKIIEIVNQIREENPTVEPDDIAVIFIDDTQATFNTADKLEQSIPRNFDWEVNKAYESKERVAGSLFVSNKNNVKGLEFPFVICVVKTITRKRNFRNALYMMLTRSFLRSYLLVSHDANIELLQNLHRGLDLIREQGYIEVAAPSDAEIERIKTVISSKVANISFYHFVYSIFEELNVLPSYETPLYEVVKAVADGCFDYDSVKEIAEFNYEKLMDGKR